MSCSLKLMMMLHPPSRQPLMCSATPDPSPPPTCAVPPPLPQCYHGAQILEAYGLGRDVVDLAFRCVGGRRTGWAVMWSIWRSGVEGGGGRAGPGRGEGAGGALVAWHTPTAKAAVQW